MVKKKHDPFAQGNNPLSSMPGGAEAARSVAESKLENLLTEVEKVNLSLSRDLGETLAKRFNLATQPKQQKWKLNSGRIVRFYELYIDYAQVKSNTFVRFEVNGRDQDFLNEQSLSDLDSMLDQQFYPAISRSDGERFEILDGSRRRARFLLANGAIEKFWMYATDDPLSESEAAEFARKLQTSKEHSLRELGKRAKALIALSKKKGGSISQSELAAQFGVSQAKISRALKCVSVNDQLVLLFGSLDELFFDDYQKLLKVQNAVGDNLHELVIAISSAVESTVFTSAPERKEYIFNSLKSMVPEFVAESKKVKTETVIPLKTFETDGVFARKRINGRKFSYEFSRLSESLQRQLDDAINEVLLANEKQ